MGCKPLKPGDQWAAVLPMPFLPPVLPTSPCPLAFFLVFPPSRCLVYRSSESLNGAPAAHLDAGLVADPGLSLTQVALVKSGGLVKVFFFFFF